jgi:superfamily II DNA or RNA helicase
MLNPWKLEVNQNDTESVELIIRNQDTKESKILNLDIDKINSLVDSKPKTNNPLHEMIKKGALRVLALSQLSSDAVIVAPPVGYGKSFLISEIIKRIISAKETVWLLNPMKEIHEQSLESLNRDNVSHGDFTAEITLRYRCIVGVNSHVVKNIDTLKERYGNPDYVIFVESANHEKLFPNSKIIIVQ